MEIRRFRDKAGKEFAINCDLVQSWTGSGGGLDNCSAPPQVTQSPSKALSTDFFATSQQGTLRRNRSDALRPTKDRGGIIKGPGDHSRGTSDSDRFHLIDGRTWSDLRLFLEVARHRPFNKAGPAIGASHPTMSRAVHRLERTLGLSLVTASETGVEMTESGAVLAKRLELIDAMIQRRSIGYREARSVKISAIVASPTTMNAAISQNL